MNRLYQEIILLTQKLITFQSTEDQQHNLQNIVNFCAEYFRDTDLFVNKYIHKGKPSLVVSTYEGLEFDVILSGHLDVVHAPQDAFLSSMKDEKLFGRGSLDMKGPDSAMIVALKQVHKIAPQHKIALLLTTDEEIGGACGVNYLVNEIGYRGKVVILPDGGDEDRLVTAQKGVVRFGLESHGIASHGSRPWLGDNAIDNMIKCYQDLQQQFPDPVKEDDWRPSINLGLIRAGQAVNKVPEHCFAGLELRYTEERSSQKCIDMVMSICKQYDVDCNVEIIGDLCFTDFNDLYLQKFKNSAETILKKSVKFGVETGSSDARYFSTLDMPVIISKPKGGNIHNGGEYIEIDSLCNYFDILVDFLINFSSVEN